MRFSDRLLTIAVTATLTSAAWIVVGSMYVDLDGPGGTEAPVDEAELAATEAPPAPRASPTGSPDARPPLQQAAPVRPGRSEVNQLVVPVLGISADQLTDTFVDGRDEGERLHEAIDIMAPAGTTVQAAAPGTVERLFTSNAGGKTIYVRSNDRQTIHYYAHLQDYAPGLKEGQVVRRGQRLGTVGATGNADPEAPHLHFAILRTTPNAEWWEPATALNPYRLLGGRTDPPRATP